MVLDEEMIQQYNISSEYIESTKKMQIEEIRRRKEEYPPKEIPLKGKIAILIDDGIATGATMFVAIKAVKKMDPKKIMVAIPVGPPDTVEKMKQEVDKVICILTPIYFGAVGSFYQIFDQTTDREVIELLEKKPRIGK